MFVFASFSLEYVILTYLYLMYTKVNDLQPSILLADSVFWKVRKNERAILFTYPHFRSTRLFNTFLYILYFLLVCLWPYSTKEPSVTESIHRRKRNIRNKVRQVHLLTLTCYRNNFTWPNVVSIILTHTYHVKICVWT